MIEQKAKIAATKKRKLQEELKKDEEPKAKVFKGECKHLNFHTNTYALIQICCFLLKCYRVLRIFDQIFIQQPKMSLKSASGRQRGVFGSQVLNQRRIKQLLNRKM